MTMEQGKGSGTGTPVYMDSGDENPDSYNKMKFHASKMDLNLRILRDQMVSIFIIMELMHILIPLMLI